MHTHIRINFSSLGGFKNPRVHSSEDLFLQKTNDELSDPTEHAAEIQVSMSEIKLNFVYVSQTSLFFTF